MRISSVFCISYRLKASAALLALIILSFAVLPGITRADDWPMFLKNPMHSPKVGKAPKQSLSLKWKFDTSGPVYSSPVVVGNTVFIGSYDKFLYALDASTGKLKWKFETGGEILSTPAVSEGVIYVGSKDGFLYALNAASGELKWKYESGGDIFTSLVLGGDMVFFASSDTFVYAVDIDSGDRVWRVKLKENAKYGGIYSSPAYKNGAIYIASKNKKLYSMDAETGSRIWSTPTKSAIYTSPVLNDGLIYVASFDRKLYAYEYEGDDAIPVFRRSIKELAYSTPAIYRGSLYLGLKNSQILVFDKKTGKKQNTFSLPGAINSSIVIDSSGVMYVGCADGHIYLLNASSGEVLWKYKTGAGIHSTPAVAGGRLYIGSKDGSLYVFE